MSRDKEWEGAFEDAKTKKAVMFIMIEEITTSTPNDQELGARIRKIINNYKLDTNTNR